MVWCAGRLVDDFPMKRVLAFLLLYVLPGAAVVHACAECGGKNKAAWLALESGPKASQIFPDARIVEYTLDIAETTLSPAGKAVRALTINGAVPGPVLRFREGDVARIHVRNRLAKGETSLHWHGLLLPNLEDGVPYLTTPPIEAPIHPHPWGPGVGISQDHPCENGIRAGAN